MHERIPCTVLTGFLGAGKTTLVQSMLRNPAGRRLALIVNEFGTAGVDGDLIKSCGLEDCDDDDVVELANGCICCTVADDFIPTLTALLERESPPDHIVIETSGLALPQPLLRAFAWPEVRARVTVDGVVTVVDARAVADGRFAADEEAVDRQRQADETLDHETPLGELFADQVSCADLIVLSKTDLITAEERAAVDAAVGAHQRPAARVIPSTASAPPPVSVLLGLTAAAELDAHHRVARHDHHHDHDHDDHDDHEHHDDHDHDAFESFVVPVAETASPDVLSARIEALGRHPSVLRIKGAVAVTGKPMRLVVQAVGPRLETYFDRPWHPDERRRGQLVVIGLAGLDQAAISAELNAEPASEAAE